MDARIAALSGAAFLGVIAGGAFLSPAGAGITSALAAPFHDSEDDHDDDHDDYDEDDGYSFEDSAAPVSDGFADTIASGPGDPASSTGYDDDDDDDDSYEDAEDHDYDHADGEDSGEHRDRGGGGDDHEDGHDDDDDGHEDDR